MPNLSEYQFKQIFLVFILALWWFVLPWVIIFLSFFALAEDDCHKKQVISDEPLSPYHKESVP